MKNVYRNRRVWPDEVYSLPWPKGALPEYLIFHDSHLTPVIVDGRRSTAIVGIDRFKPPPDADLRNCCRGCGRRLFWSHRGELKCAFCFDYQAKGVISNDVFGWILSPGVGYESGMWHEYDQFRALETPSERFERRCAEIWELGIIWRHRVIPMECYQDAVR